MNLPELRRLMEQLPQRCDCPCTTCAVLNHVPPLLDVVEKASAFVTRSRLWAEGKVSAAEVQVAEDALAAELKRLKEV